MNNLSYSQNFPTATLEANNATEEDAPQCFELLREVDWSDLSILFSFIILGLINLLVICGNTLVIVAVYVSSKLRTVTNFFIVSLAVADLLVGVLVLPFSATYEVLDIWIFGYIWCKFWLAIDVWMCTASILNLCAISLDRYLAVTRPVSYPSIMSSKRAKILIAGVWCFSFIICFPPLAGWNESGPSDVESRDNLSHVFHSNLGEVILSFSENKTFPAYIMNETEYTPPSVNVGPSSSSFPEEEENTDCMCQLISDRGYRIYSSLGSFYLPMFVMMFFYWKIYRAAVETTRAINQGFKTTKCGSSIGGRFDEQRMTLRIHRGKSTVDFCAANSKTNGTCGSTSRNLNSSRSLREKHVKKGSRMKTSASFPPPEESSSLRPNKSFKSRTSSTSSSSHKRLWSFGSNKHKVSKDLGSPSDRRKATRTVSTSSTEPNDDPGDDGFKKGAQVFSRMGKRNIKAQVKRFKTEKKAAKTLGIIVSGFIVCWFPFFTIYLVGAFCTHDDCIPQSLFSVFFWLGYCNSAINPCLYALFSRDFRYAFKKILCKCVFVEEVSFKERIVTMIPAVIHLNSFNDESEAGSDSH